MATGGLQLLRKNDAYIGWAKQAAWGTAVAPTSFWRWLPGTAHKPTIKMQSEREGDTQIHVSLGYKVGQYHQIKVVEYGRPITLGCAIQSLFGTGSDSLVTATTSTTVGTGGGVAGGTTLPFTADQGNTGTKSFGVNPGIGNATFEVITIDCTTRSGAGPYVYTLNAGATLKFAHSAAEVIRSASTHTLTPQRTTYDPYSLEVGLGPSGNSPQQAFRYTDAVCTDLTLTSGPGGSPIKCEHTWYACGVKQLSALTSVTPSSYEGTNVPGGAGGPLLHSMAGSSWQVDGAGTGIAAGIKAAQLKMSRSLNPDQFITESVVPNYFLLGNLDTELTLQALFTSYQQYRETVLGAASAGNNAVDSYLTGFGSAAWTYTGDAVNSLAINLANAFYMMADLPQLSNTSDPMEVSVQMKGETSPSVSTPLTLTLANTQNTAY